MVVIEHQQETKASLNGNDGIVIQQFDIDLGKETAIVITFANIDSFIAALCSLQSEAIRNRSEEEE